MKQIRAYLNICVDNEAIAKTIYKSLIPEVESKPSKERGEVYLDLNDNCVVLDIYARDISSLRAILNGYLYLVHALSNTIDIVRRNT